ncbi:hypothetical protein [Pendulispora albinea]|uniref:Uncharacterized protein n=1 Tax=Pendulispora albinea TaxID=2741071 RepID=A0ABZ2M4P2_9BACT
MFAALEFDHALFQPQIRWIVVECDHLARKCGGPIAVSPRHDVAYFVHRQTAADDARCFADFKNRERGGVLDDELRNLLNAVAHKEVPSRHFAYPWDHQLMAGLPLQWAVLEWSGNENESCTRVDAAYFVDPETAERDARVFATMRDRHLVARATDWLQAR